MVALMTLFRLVSFVLFFGVISGSDVKCRTMSGIEGVCVELQRCPKVLNIINNAKKPLSQFLINTLRQLQCSTNSRQVCCVGNIVNTCTPPNVRNHKNLNLINQNCGLDSQDRISKGNVTELGEFPWMALLKYVSDDREEFACGGTIINERYILTAAHCLTDLGRRSLVGVRVGEHDTETENDCAGPAILRYCAPQVQDIRVERTYVHPEYLKTINSERQVKMINDIGLVRLERKIDFSEENVGTICLPTNTKTQAADLKDEILEIAGWGFTEQGLKSNVMLKANLKTIENDVCEERLKKSIDGGIECSQVCAAGDMGANSCPGDSGGPLKYLKNVHGTLRYVQHGVVSLGPKNCGVYNVPAIYTKVGYYMDWILDQLKP